MADDQKKTCPHCGAATIEGKNRVLSCPSCGNDGCLECIMAGGVGCTCTECEGVDD